MKSMSNKVESSISRNLLLTSDGIHLSNSEYREAIRYCLLGAKKVIRSSLFAIDIRPESDLNGDVVSILRSLSLCSRRGISTSVILDSARAGTLSVMINRPPELYLSLRGVPVRFWDSRNEKRTQHSKIVVIDDYVFIGNHNWTHNSFNNNEEASVLLKGSAISTLALETFDEQWRNSYELSKPR